MRILDPVLILILVFSPLVRGGEGMRETDTTTMPTSARHSRRLWKRERKLGLGKQ